MSYSIRNSFISYDEHATCVVKINVLLHIYGNFIYEYCDDDSNNHDGANDDPNQQDDDDDASIANKKNMPDIKRRPRDSVDRVVITSPLFFFKEEETYFKSMGKNYAK